MVVPRATPVNPPELEPIVATAVLVLLHVPPPASVRFISAPRHPVEPVIAAGFGLMVNIAEAVLPVALVMRQPRAAL